MQWTGNPSVHLAFEAAGYAAAALVYIAVRQRRGDAIPDRARAAVIAGAAAGAAIGARLLVLFHGKTVVGGLLGGLIGVELAKWMIGVTRSTGDLFVLPLATAMCIGRIGCFLTGPIDHTAGNPTSLPWAMAVGDGVPRHPVALYEIAFLMLLILVIPSVSEGPGGMGGAPSARPAPSLTLGMTWREGDRFRIFLAGYLAFRLAVDFLKPDPPPILLGMSAIQWACVAGLIYYALVLSNDQRSAAVPLLRRRRLDLHDVLPQD
jgi:prolipoprotein diacylglyceryltransferase